jgi:hypothetical protein
MSSFFDSLKKSIGMGSSAKPPVKAAQALNTFDVLFREEKLGMVIEEYDLRGIVKNGGVGAKVQSIHSGSEAERLSKLNPLNFLFVFDFSLEINIEVKVGDVIIALEKNSLQKFNDFYEFLGVLPRPMSIT